MLVRTVFDNRTNRRKFLRSVLILLASWHKFAQANTNFDFLYIGELPVALRVYLDSLGVTYQAVEPNINDDYSKTSNAIQGATATPNQRLLLVDNDVVFTASLEGLAKIDAQCIAAAIPGSFRLNDAQWAIINDELQLPTLATNKISLKEQYEALSGTVHQNRQLNHTYVNAGVLLVPQGLDLKSTWEKQVQIIAMHFANHKLRSMAVVGSNQAGLATAIALHGKFSWLSIDYNFRPLCFALGMKRLHEIKIVHLTANIKEDLNYNLTECISVYWDLWIKSNILALDKYIDANELDSRLTVADGIKKTLDGLIVEYQLDKIYSKLENKSVH